MSQSSTMNSDIESMHRIQLGLLKDDRLSSQKIEVKVNDGIVILTGTVASFRRKLVAQQIVATFANVRDVRNELKVEPSHPASDQEIVDDVRSTLDASADITKETIIVSVANGLVSLTGTVSSNWERISAEDIVRGVRGVRDVSNMLKVNAVRANEDGQLIGDVQAAIRVARGLENVDIHVAIGEDTVVLSGCVKAPWMRDVAATVVGGFGFLRIRNEIQITE